MIDQILKWYDEGAIATREAAQKVLCHATEANKAHFIEEIQKRSHLDDAVKEVVRDFKDLTDEKWDTLRTCEPGAYTRPFTAQENLDREARYKRENQQLRVGVEVMKDYA